MNGQLFKHLKAIKKSPYLFFASILFLRTMDFKYPRKQKSF